MVNSKLLKTKMAKENVNQEYLAYKLKIAQPTLNLKINNNRSFTIEEMFDLAEILNIDPGDLRQFFLA
ncbi:DNA-binding helix-turn-helix protein [Peptoniphilus sp. oral taxon 375 str. F0436]|nr:DNA-binding helix-turn-helix protein [Peptoniphilus sp. oral taxon 375 str. F0436]